MSNASEGAGRATRGRKSLTQRHRVFLTQRRADAREENTERSGRRGGMSSEVSESSEESGGSLTGVA